MATGVVDARAFAACPTDRARRAVTTIRDASPDVCASARADGVLGTEHILARVLAPGTEDACGQRVVGRDRPAFGSAGRRACIVGYRGASTVEVEYATIPGVFLRTAVPDLLAEESGWTREVAIPAERGTLGLFLVEDASLFVGAKRRIRRFLLVNDTVAVVVDSVADFGRWKHSRRAFRRKPGRCQERGEHDKQQGPRHGTVHRRSLRCARSDSQLAFEQHEICNSPPPIASRILCDDATSPAMTTAIRPPACSRVNRSS